uniref:Uncharacterized protein n=1 Tax=Rhizophora mucronata TaxID=61149 RepID=A0A2P2IYS9_RHIMU
MAVEFRSMEQASCWTQRLLMIIRSQFFSIFHVIYFLDDPITPPFPTKTTPPFSLYSCLCFNRLER